MTESIKDLIKSVQTDVCKWRRHIHANPELSFQEFETAKYIYQELSQFKNLELQQLTPNSVQALLKGSKPGKRIALRADIDALPLQEESGETFSSTKENIMHACGHDVHTAMLMGAVKVLSQLQDKISGEVLFIFQHAEEVPPGGAQDLIEKGVLKDVSMIFGLHVWPGAPTGSVFIKPGVFCASTDNFDIKIQGKGGHGSMPHYSIDPVIIASHVVTSMQSIISRRLDPIFAPVLTIAKLQAGNSYNVIPDSAELAGTLRTHNKDVRREVPKLVEQTVSGICAAFDSTCNIEWTPGYTVGVNDPEACEIAKSMLEKNFPEYNVQTFENAMFGGEDFAAYLEHVQGGFFMIGAHNQEKMGEAYNVHHPKFRIDEEAMQVGISVHVGLIQHLLM